MELKNLDLVQQIISRGEDLLKDLTLKPQAELVGNNFFNYNFREDFDSNDLFSSFISAFNTLSSEVFSKTIDWIKIGGKFYIYETG